MELVKVNDRKRMVFSLKEAAEAVNMTKPALLKSIQKDKLSATHDDKNQWQIDPAELFRVYKPETETKSEKLTIGNTKETALLSVQIESLRRENEFLRDQLKREQENADHWRQQATNLLTHQPEPKPEPTEAPAIASAPKTSPLWVRLFGRASG